MKQDVVFAEDEYYSIIKFLDSENYVFEKAVEPQDKPVVIGLTKQGEIRVKAIEFPKTIYSAEDVKATADKIKTRFEQEGCKSCIALAEASNTKQTFNTPFPTPKELFLKLYEDIFDASE